MMILECTNNTYTHLSCANCINLEKLYIAASLLPLYIPRCNYSLTAIDITSVNAHRGELFTRLYKILQNEN